MYLCIGRRDSLYTKCNVTTSAFRSNAAQRGDCMFIGMSCSDHLSILPIMALETDIQENIAKTV